MGFWDEYKEVGGDYISADEKKVLMDEGIPLQILQIVEDEHREFGLRYVCKVVVPDPESGEDSERALSFPIGTVESRDRMLKQLSEYLDKEDAEDVFVKLEKVGRSIILRQATPLD